MVIYETYELFERSGDITDILGLVWEDLPFSTPRILYATVSTGFGAKVLGTKFCVGPILSSSVAMHVCLLKATFGLVFVCKVTCK